ncbi:MAG: hemolysin III family protein [Arenicellales bacterium]
MSSPKFYSPLEEKFNIYSHGLGIILSLIALFLLSTHQLIEGSLLYKISFIVFGVSLVMLYSASTLYHSATTPELRQRRRILDHASIYVLIAGTYTPFCLITLGNETGRNIFIISWLMAIAGIILKIFFTGRFRLLSTLLYVFMGWMIIFAISDLSIKLSAEGMFWLVAGGLAYSVGAILYSIKRIPLNHALFHVFVLIGSACHFMSVYFYVLPIKVV